VAICQRSRREDQHCGITHKSKKVLATNKEEELKIEPPPTRPNWLIFEEVTDDPRGSFRKRVWQKKNAGARQAHCPNT